MQGPTSWRQLRFLVLGLVLAGLLALGLFWPFKTSGATVTLPASLPSVVGRGRVELPKIGSSVAQPVVVTFYASWCAPCEAEIPQIVRFVRAEKAKGVKVSFIGIDENDTEGGRAFTVKSGFDFPTGSDPDGDVLADLDATPALPQTIFIDTEGNIVHHVYGSVTADSVLETWVKNLTSA